MNKQEWESLFERAQGERASKWQWWVAESHVETSEGPVGSNARIVPYVESARTFPPSLFFLHFTAVNWINNYSRECEFIMSQEFPRKQYMCVNMIKPQIIKKIIKKLLHKKCVIEKNSIIFFTFPRLKSYFYEYISIEMASLKDGKD